MLNEIINDYNETMKGLEKRYLKDIEDNKYYFAYRFSKVSIDEFKKLSLDELYKIYTKYNLGSITNDVIDIIEEKKNEVRLEKGFVQYNSLNKDSSLNRNNKKVFVFNKELNINIPNNIRIRIEDKLIEACKLKTYLPLNYFTNLKIVEDESENSIIWIYLLFTLKDYGEAIIDFKLKCKECLSTIINIGSLPYYIAFHFLSIINEYPIDKIETLDNIIDNNKPSLFNEGACEKCDLWYDYKDLHEQSKKIFDEIKIKILTPKNFKNRNFYPTKKI